MKNNPVVQAALAIVLVLAVSFFMNRDSLESVTTSVDNVETPVVYPYAGSEPNPSPVSRLPSATIGMRKIQNQYNIDLQTDAKSLYIYGNKVEGLDPNWFKFLTRDILVDKKGVFFIQYLMAEKIENLSPENIRVVTNEPSIVLANDTQVYGNIYHGYFKGRFIDIVENPSKLARVNRAEDGASSLTDGKGLYVVTDQHFIRLPIVTPVVLKHSLYVRGDDNVYYDSVLIRDADARTFKLLNEYRFEDEVRPRAFYAQDANKVYYKGKVIAEADSDTFKLYPARYYDEYARDKAHVYYNGEVIPGADVVSFVVLKTQQYEGCSDGSYSKDKNAVYFGTRKIIGADPSSFEVLRNGYARDAQHSYYGDILMPDAPNELEVVCYYA